MGETSPHAARAIGAMLCCGVRGATQDDPLLQADLDACFDAKVGSIILFDVHVPGWVAMKASEIPGDEARTQATRNITSPEQLRTLIAHIRSRLGPDTIIAIDQEGGQTSRLTRQRGFHDDPAAIEFAALAPNERRSAADQQARQLARLGIDLNFAPCVDVAIAPDGPVIAALGRSYSADPSIVTDCARIVIHAHRHHGISCCLKHFPGHGSASGDTHFGIVDVTDSHDQSLELAPYRDLIATDQPDAIMAAHVLCRTIDPDHPASLSRLTLTSLLREKLNFRGTIITDSLDMRAIVDRYGPDEALINTTNAGADMLINAFNLDDAENHPALAMADALARALAENHIDGGIERLEASDARTRTLRRRANQSTMAEFSTPESDPDSR